MLTYLTGIRDVRRDAIEEALIQAEESQEQQPEETQQDDTATDTTE